MEKKGYVLTVDDSHLVQTTLRTYLKIIGFDVDSAQDGLEGYAKAQEKNYTLVFSDYEMPNMNGLQFLEKLKKLPQYKNIPVVMLTTVDDSGVIEKAKALGAFQYMIKPFNNEKMQQVLKQIGIIS